MRGSNSTWQEEQVRRSFLFGKTVEYLVYNEGAKDLCAQDKQREQTTRVGRTQSLRSWEGLPQSQ